MSCHLAHPESVANFVLLALRYKLLSVDSQEWMTVRIWSLDNRVSSISYQVTSSKDKCLTGGHVMKLWAEDDDSDTTASLGLWIWLWWKGRRFCRMWDKARLLLLNLNLVLMIWNTSGSAAFHTSRILHWLIKEVMDEWSVEQADDEKQMLFWLLWCVKVTSLEWSWLTELALMTVTLGGTVV